MPSGGGYSTAERDELMKVNGEYFYGNKISEYGVKYGYVDYATLAKAVNHVLNNDILGVLNKAGMYAEPVSGDEMENEVFQWYITDENGAKILSEAHEIVVYVPEADMYLWGVTHFGTGWDYVLTDIKCNCG